MKTTTVLFFLFFVFAITYAQNYQISFAGTGASSTVDSIKVENLTQCTSINLSGGDILHLTATLGLNELNNGADNSMQIYPNPMTGNCTVNFESTDKCETTIELYDITGKRILQMNELLLKGHHTYNLTGIRSGIYTLKIESDKYSYTSKIISNNSAIGEAEIKHIEATNEGNIRSLKSINSIIDMLFTTGDILKFTGFSGGIYRTLFMLVPTQTQTVTFNFVACSDPDNNHYTVVQIGTQMWMAENIKTTKYRNGDPISYLDGNTAWSNSTIGAHCYYNSDINNLTTYGRLYNWYAIYDSRNIAPIGWHVPSDAEWATLTTYLGGESVAGGKLKENCVTLWQSPNTGATNETGFSAYPGGYRNNIGIFSDIGVGYWWSATDYFSTNAYYRTMYYNSDDVLRNFCLLNWGLFIRCVKD